MQNNNIYYKKNQFQSSYVQITDTGVMGQIFNGVPDWVYEGTFNFIQTNYN